MTLDIGNTDRLNVFRQEAQRRGIRIAPPDINRSEAFFACDADACVIYYALAAVKGVGRQAMEHVVAERAANGPFQSLGDFARRVDPRLVNKRAFESLARAGAFEVLHPNRRELVEASDYILSDAARSTRERESGQVSLFGEETTETDTLKLPAVAAWQQHERLSEEFNAIGFYLTGHPLDSFDAALKRLGVVTFTSLLEDKRRSGFAAEIAGTIIRKQERRGRSDQSYAFVALSDPTGMFEVMIFSEVLATSRQLLEPGKSVLMKVAVDNMDDELKLRALSIRDLDSAVAQAGEGLRIYLENADPLNAIAAQMRVAGKGIVTVVVSSEGGREIEIALPKRVAVNHALKAAIKSFRGVSDVMTV